MKTKQEDYKIVNGTFYKKDTPDEVIDILEDSRINKTRLIFDFGDIKTGQSWGEVDDIAGHVGRSTGNIKIPLLIKTSRSFGGGALLDNCIVKISLSKGKKVLYQHKNYKSAN